MPLKYRENLEEKMAIFQRAYEIRNTEKPRQVILKRKRPCIGNLLPGLLESRKKQTELRPFMISIFKLTKKIRELEKNETVISSVTGYCDYSLALWLCPLGEICAIEELALEQLHCYHTEDEVEQQIHNKDVKHVLQ